VLNNCLESLPSLILGGRLVPSTMAPLMNLPSSLLLLLAVLLPVTGALPSIRASHDLEDIQTAEHVFRNQVPLSALSDTRSTQFGIGETRKLKGKFLHITDIHPDPFYKVHSDTEGESACHRHKGSAGVYGAETSDCDSPISLLNATFNWIKENLKDEIDFVVWTGDSARHDNDDSIPRSRAQVEGQNELIVSKFLEVFGKPENFDDDDPTNDFAIPIVPSLGNNDILPHNIFTKGPNRWTAKYLSIWRQFIPEEQRHQFQRGGWFYVEVVPNHLAVFSLNTMYFFESNSAVDGCASKHEPGYEQFEWLRIQLEILRGRGMKAILTGHVPPARVDSKTSWDETCWQKYALWLKQYRDVIVTSLYGHMNIDHFMFQDFKDIKKRLNKGYDYMARDAAVKRIPTEDEMDSDGDYEDEEELTIQSASDYLLGLRDMFAKIPRIIVAHGEVDNQKKKKTADAIGGEYGERYSLAFVAPSIVPNYFPTLRVFSYNVSALDNVPLSRSDRQPEPFPATVAAESETEELAPHHWDLRSIFDWTGPSDSADALRKKKKHKKKRKKNKFVKPEGPSKTSLPGPAYSPQPLSIVGYTQYFANLTYINNDFQTSDDGELDEFSRWKPGKHAGKKPKHEKPSPNPFKYEVEYDTSGDKAYSLPDLTVRSYLDLAGRIAQGMKRAGGDMVTDGKREKKKKKSDNEWLAFVRRAFVGTLEPDEIEPLYGRH
jgi:endopolyphosphatase